MEASDDLSADLAELFATAEKKQPPKKITKLPAFLFEGATTDVEIYSERPSEETQDREFLEAFLPRASAEVQYGSAEEECERLLSETSEDVLTVFKLPPYATEADVKKAFRKISLLIHPDKCSHPRAQEAFHIITKALEGANKIELREEYKAVVAEAKRIVREARTGENQLRKKKNLPLLPTDDDNLRELIRAECKKLINKVAEDIAYAERTKQANLERELRMQMEREQQEREELERQRLWAEKREERAQEWKDYQAKLKAKKKNTLHSIRVEPRKEERPQKRTKHFACPKNQSLTPEDSQSLA